MEFWYALTLLATPELWMLVCAGLVLFYLYIRKYRVKKQAERRWLKSFLFVFVVSLLLTFAVVQSLKLVLQVPRLCMPCPGPGCNPYCPATGLFGLVPAYSFPSGHASIIFALFTALYLGVRRRWFWPLFILPVLVALSRFMLGVHTMPDIVGGALIGTAITLAVWRLEKRAKIEYF